jgi:hypothetical protein
MIEPPPDSTRALTHTVSDSPRTPCAAICVWARDAAWMIWSQVTGLLMSRPIPATADLRYQRSWVLAQNGTATRRPCQVEASIELGNRSSRAAASTAGGIGARKPACANSGT